MAKKIESKNFYLKEKPDGLQIVHKGDNKVMSELKAQDGQYVASCKTYPNPVEAFYDQLSDLARLE